MGLFDWIGGQFIDVIDWTDDSHDTMVYRFNRQGNEIKYGAKLIVRASQVAVFVNEGEIADVLTAGTYELETKNIPILTSLKHWDHGFNSPFKAEVYFLNTKRFIDLRWGTKNPIMIRDPEFTMVRLRAFGTYEIKIDDPKVFMTEIVGTDGHFTTDEIDKQLTNLIVSKFATVIGKSNTPILDMAGNYELFGNFITEKISGYFTEYGLELTKILIENISLPPEVEKAMDSRSSRAIFGNLDDYLKYQSAEALANGGTNGAMGNIVEIGAGMAMGQQIAQSISNSMQQQHSTPSMPPPPIPQSILYHIARDGVAEGPYPVSAIIEYINNGTVMRDTLVWSEDMDGWIEAGVVFSDNFRQTPPPLI
ncbi:MAG: SPFH domain-containing protein [Sulfurovum sp.]|nr:SPFH domain-containing protein [Sulfurovaceae bacterium]